jgi:superfamily I DNA/RNA helicase
MATHKIEVNLASIIEDRARFTDVIIKSSAKRKLIVAGPGTGKTYTFKQALTAAGGRGLALTFINNLARELETELAAVADSNTFHGFCKSLLHRIPTDGLTTDFDYYPPLPILVAQDMEICEQIQISDEELTKCFRTLDDEQEMISKALRIGAYYDAVGHDDAVYRVFQHLMKNPNCVPKFPLVVVDEYQDFNLLETRFIEILAQANPVLIAGDDDQALYQFKNASPTYIRELARDNNYEKFELPYCSRCTEVIVESVRDVLKQVGKEGLLTERLPKSYLYYSPDKSEDSMRHPRITHAHCSVETNGSPYIGAYVAERIAEIPADEIHESREKHYPTALVIGPVEFVKRVYDVLKTRFNDIVLKTSSPPEILILDGYRRLYRNENSRLGWRIVLTCDPSTWTGQIIETALKDERDLSGLIPREYRKRHLQMARLAGRFGEGQILTAEEKDALSEAVGEPFAAIEKALVVSEEEAPSVSSNGPSVICTSLLGAKGLSASRVFIVGFNDTHFPRNPAAITDDEARSLIVALSRTRIQCYVVSCGRFGGMQLQASIFLRWFGDRIEHEFVDKIWMDQHRGVVVEGS